MSASGYQQGGAVTFVDTQPSMPAHSLAACARYIQSPSIMHSYSCKRQAVLLFGSQSLLPRNVSSKCQYHISSYIPFCICAPLFDASMVAASTAAHACSVVATEEFAAAGAGARAASGTGCAVAPYAIAMH